MIESIENFKKSHPDWVAKYETVISKIKTWWHKGLTYYHESPWYRKTIIVIVSIFVGFMVLLGLVDMNFLWLFGKSPGLSAVRDPHQAQASMIYSADGKLIGKYFRENRTPVTYGEISPILIKSLIVTEDERFYQHFGIDLKGVFAAMKDMTHGNARGASTITQQLVKNLFKIRSQYSTGLLGYIPGVRLAIMKSKEWILAVKIESAYSKRDILTMYFNTVDFGSNAYGIKTACKTYFRTTPSRITTEQAATLVGLLKATTYYNPRINPKNSRRRRNVVLDNLMTHHIISRPVCDSLKALPILLQYEVENNYGGVALYFREAVAASLESWCKKNDVDLYSDGLKIYTTLDTRLQAYAEYAVDRQMRVIQRNFNNHWRGQNPWKDEKGEDIPNFIEDLAKRTTTYKQLVQRFPDRPDSIDYYLNLPHRLKVFDYDLGTKDTTFSTLDSIRYMERFMHCGFIAMDPHSGEVKAWVGDINFNSWKYDKVLSKRQPGSTFKLFVYSEAMNQGMSPCEARCDEPVSWEVMEKGEKKLWIPRNANGYCTYDSMTLKEAFAQSCNVIAVQVAKQIGIHNIAMTARAMGIKTPLEEEPALSLGSSDVSLEELVNAYSTVVNEGKRHDPILVTKIVDKDGKVIYRNEENQVQAISYETAFLMTQMLKGGMTERGGTSQALWAFKLFDYDTEFGGKTGTSSHHSDAWYIGTTPNLIAGAWVGGEHRSIHFRTGELGQGSRTALPIYAYFMEKVLADPAFMQYRGKFATSPKTPIDRPYDCHVYYPHHSHEDSLFIDNDTAMIDDEFLTNPLKDDDKETNGE